MPLHVDIAYLGLLFAIGLVHDCLAFRCFSAATQGRPKEAAFLSAFLTAFSFVAWALMCWTGAEGTVRGIAAYALGSGAGTWLALRAPKKEPVD